METFDRDKRLLTAADYHYVFDNATYKLSHRHYLLLARQNNRGHARLGLVVAKKNVKLATRRNRIKRVARDTFRKHQSVLDSLDIVFLARRGLDTLEPNFQSRLLREAWEGLATRVGKVP